ncbi:hypothetical protein D9611_004546 [Ephemerocybe angulata]|uniref:Origin recognition complex subunit 5 n=1 Tax=Ephemerocybe angulata TaxID=980116 RepID=A0A8H5F5Z1_9AGAR|nr:hypothetical protein D9611_004546 [Tulosesus angulatus]
MASLPPSTEHSNFAPGYEDVVVELSTLISYGPPPFIYVHDAQTSKVTANVLGNTLSSLPSEPGPSSRSPTTRICVGHVDAIRSYSPRLLFESLIHSLVGHEPGWDDGCPNWSGDREGDFRWNENVDAFLQGLRAAHAHLCAQDTSSKFMDGNKNAKGKTKGDLFDGVRLVLVVERAERLKDTMPELLVPLARLQELARLDLCVIFASEVGWDSVKPPLGAAPDPYFIDVPPLSKENTVNIIASRYPALSAEDPEVYHPALQMLYSHFISMVCDVCHMHTHDPHELQYIAAARWPGFIKPLRDEHHARQKEIEAETDGEGEFEDIEPPSEDTRLRLTRLFGASLSQALETLYPRLTNASDWAKVNQPPADLLSRSRAEAKIGTVEPDSMLGTGSLLGHLPRVSKFILIASFLASTNPAKSDLRMFGRGLDDKKRKRRRAQATVKPKGGVTKVPQRLLGPSPFPLDRLIAILGALLEEHDVESRLPAPELSIAGESTDMETSRVSIYAAIQELTSSRLMHRTTKPEVIDGPPMFKCAISYDLALVLSKEVKVSLSDLLWDQM